MNKYLKYGLLFVMIALLAYKSVYFQKLSARKSTKAVDFNAAEFSGRLWREKMPAKMDSAILLATLIDAVSKEGEAAINKYTNALAIGNYRYALVKLTGTVTSVNEDEVLVSIKNGDSLLTVNVATEFIYGNAIRDASGLVMVKDFPNTADLNSISEELNKTVRSSVLPSFKMEIKNGDSISIVGALELNKEHIHWQGIEILPLRIEIVK